MKKIKLPTKLVLKREQLRILVSSDLGRVAGGEPLTPNCLTNSNKLQTCG